MNPFLLCLTILALLLLPASAAPPVNDRDIHQKLLKYGEEQIAAGKVVSATDLGAQLDRKSCELKVTPASAIALPLPELAANRRAAVAVVGGIFKCKKCSNWHLGAAGGFFIAESGVLVTCHHVVANADNAALVVMTGDGRLTHVREVLAADRNGDVAILQCEGSGFATLPLAADAQVGAPVSVLSHPEDKFYMLTQGIVSRYFVDPSRHGAEMMSITADFAKGSSGAPVFDANGNVVAMVSNTRSVYYDEKDGHPENLQMVFKNCATGKAILALIKVP